jgi:hypothetical protein
LAPAAVWAQAPVSGGDSLLQVLVDSASTPAQHQALARCFRARAAEAKVAAITEDTRRLLGIADRPGSSGRRASGR